jgi:DNA-directed RNA polymerase specialized sigma24 family protein
MPPNEPAADRTPRQRRNDFEICRAMSPRERQIAVRLLADIGPSSIAADLGASPEEIGRVREQIQQHLQAVPGVGTRRSEQEKAAFATVLKKYEARWQSAIERRVGDFPRQVTLPGGRVALGARGVAKDLLQNAILRAYKCPNFDPTRDEREVKEYIDNAIEWELSEYFRKNACFRLDEKCLRLLGEQGIPEAALEQLRGRAGLFDTTFHDKEAFLSRLGQALGASSPQQTELVVRAAQGWRKEVAESQLAPGATSCLRNGAAARERPLVWQSVSAEARSQLLAALVRLPPEMARIVVLRMLGVSHRQIAALLLLTRGEVNMRYHRAKQFVAAAIGADPLPDDREE